MSITIENQGPNVFRLSEGRRQIVIIGTAHVSKESAELVCQQISTFKPNVVAVELCSSRLESVQNPARWQDTDIFQVILKGKAYVLIAQLVLASYQKRLAAELDIKPGLEMLTAISSGKEIDAKVLPIDRDIRVTLKRAWAKTSLWSFGKIVCSLIDGMFTQRQVSAAEIEKLKEHDALTAVLSELSDELPQLKTALVDERDVYMAAKIKEIQEERIVVVVGAGHVPGILKLINGSPNAEELNIVPPPSKAFLALTYSVPVSVLLLIGYAFVNVGSVAGMKMTIAWILAHGVLSALGALIVMAHPLTALAAFIASPITALIPTIGAGSVCGLVEAFIRKPVVRDLQSLSDDLLSIKGVWRNQALRIFGVVLFSDIGSALGTAVGVGWMIKIFDSLN